MMSKLTPTPYSSSPDPIKHDEMISDRDSPLPLEHFGRKTQLRTHRDDYELHRKPSPNGQTRSTSERWGYIGTAGPGAGSTLGSVGHDASRLPFHPSPRLQMQPSTTSSHEDTVSPQPFNNHLQGTGNTDWNEGAAISLANNIAQINISDVPTESQPEMQPAEEEHIPFSYQIPPDIMVAAQEAPEGSKASYWSHRMYRGPNGEEVVTHYCTNIQVSELAAKHFLGEKVLGFDIEWKIHALRSSRKENASLIQIASESRIALFHIALFPGYKLEHLVPPTLKKILESPDILKVGVAVKGDFTRLRTYLDIHSRFVMELSRTHNLVEAEDPSKADYKLVTLATQVRRHLGLPLYKGEALTDDPEPENEKERVEWLKRQSVRTSDWSKMLDYHQIRYAAADAYAGVCLYDVLEAKRKQFDPIRPLPRLCDDDPPSRPKPSGVTKKSRAKKPLKNNKAEIVAEALVGMSPEEAEEEDTQEYETAAEELEAQNKEDIESEEWEEADGNDDPDGEYIPRKSEIASAQDAPVDADQISPVRTRFIGRLNLSKLQEADPGYPSLPTLSPEEANVSDEQPISSIPEHQIQQDAPQRDAAQSNPLKAVHDEESGEFSDPELEEALQYIDIEKGLTQTDPQEALPEALVNQPPTSVDTTDSGSELDLYPTTTATDEPSHPTPYTIATNWAQHYLNSTIPSTIPSPQTSRIRATIPHLRAYHLWHIQNVSLEAIAHHLRDPPLAQSTVANYILQAISLERLVYEEDRLKDLVKSMPAALRSGRWKGICEKFGVV
ncbi:unnamed protein product [Periconia digitata]|uniref:3'-5' exonuclease domain-containing protein n=1 Tax=Periconia digitata TaxID=1303443 RepID=A0A9W4XWX3_9PLEO|nr:unnamed protein product [Periconia digitata]